MMDAVVKRLHVSGLTPQISYEDLKKRFSTFGNVSALDGFGKLDALGQPRPYAYITLETTKGQLSRCLNLLSGTTWKGAKLRIGEAKPDFAERIRKENEEAESMPPKKRRRLARGCAGVHAADMSVVTPESTSLRSGWRRTPLGRLVRPMRMRPLHPLPPPESTSLTSRGSAQELYKKKKKKKEEKLVRARRQLIDPEMWGNEYLSGIMLEGGSNRILPEKSAEALRAEALALITKDTKVGTTPKSSGKPEISRPPKEPAQTPPPSSRSTSPEPPVVKTPPPQRPAEILVKPQPLPQSQSQSQAQLDLAAESSRGLALLSSLFEVTSSNRNEDDWGGSESLSDLEVDITELAKPTQSRRKAQDEPEDDIEYVSREPSKLSKPTLTENVVQEDVDISMDNLHDEQATLLPDVEEEVEQEEEQEQEEIDERVEEEVEEEVEEAEEKADEVASSEKGEVPEAATPEAQAIKPTVQTTKLKDMFAPQAEEGTFSIFGNLNIDLDLDDDFALPTAPDPEPIYEEQVVSSAQYRQHSFGDHHQQQQQQQQQRTNNNNNNFSTPDSSQPFFFPLLSSLPSSNFSSSLSSSDPPNATPSPFSNLSNPKYKSKGSEKSTTHKDIFTFLTSLGLTTENMFGFCKTSGLSGHTNININTNDNDNEEEAIERIKKERWENQKLELTRDWKRRHREALKSLKRRGGGAGAERGLERD